MPKKNDNAQITVKFVTNGKTEQEAVYDYDVLSVARFCMISVLSLLTSLHLATKGHRKI